MNKTNQILEKSNEQENIDALNFLLNLPEIPQKYIPYFERQEQIEKGTDVLYQVGEYSLLPIRCYTCGKLFTYQNIITNSILHGYKIKNILDALGYNRTCCRTVILSHPIIKAYIDYYNDIYEEYMNIISE